MDVLSHTFASQALKSIQSEARSAAGQPFSVLVVGSQGSGKTSWATAIAKAKGTYLVIEASQAPKNLKEWRQLFSESSAVSFIFENIDKWSEATQNSLAHVFKDSNGKMEKHFVSTAGQEIHSKLSQGQFRNDLYYRLSVRPLNLPQLDQCVEDIQAAADFWLDVHSLVIGRKKPTLSANALLKLQSADWQGAWSEFIAVLERAVSYNIETVSEEHLVQIQIPQVQSSLQAGLTLAEMEKKLIIQTLKLTASNKSQAARLLGISIRTLRNKLNEYRQEGFHELI